MKLKYNSKMHGYWLDGKRCKSPSGVAKVPDDQTSLNRWKLRQALTGIALRPELATRIAAANGNKDDLDAICEEAIHAAGGNAGRDRGSAVHAITEHLDGGATLLETPEVVAVRQQWNDLLDRYGLEVVHTEGVILHPDLKIAGRFDRIVRCPDGKLRIGDIKTGADAHKYLHAHAVQLWLYASAPLIADGPQGDTDFEITEFKPMYELDQEVAYVFHLPADGTPDVVGVNIAAGKDCYHNVIGPTWAWRNRRDLGVEVEAVKVGKIRSTAKNNPTATVTAPTRPDEGETPVDVEELRKAYDALPEAGRKWIGQRAIEARQALVPFNVSELKSERRAGIMGGLVALAANDAADDESLRAIVRFVTTDDSVEWPTLPVGASLGTLGAEEATLFAATCRAYVGGMLAFDFASGRPVLVEVK
jgi:hypothetical protein